MKKNDFKLLGIGFLVLAFIAGIIYLIFNIDNFKVYTFDFNLQTKESYAANEVIATYVDEDTLVQNYYMDFVTLLIYDREEAYKLLSKEAKEGDYPSLEIFNNKVDEMFENGLLEATVSEYLKSESDNKKIYTITDSKENKITIIENSIMDYKVNI